MTEPSAKNVVFIKEFDGLTFFKEEKKPKELEELKIVFDSFQNFIIQDTRIVRNLSLVQAQELLALNQELQSFYQSADSLAKDIIHKQLVQESDKEQIRILTSSLHLLLQYLENKTLSEEERNTLKNNVSTILYYVQVDWKNSGQKEKWEPLLLGLAGILFLTFIASAFFPVLLAGTTLLPLFAIALICTVTTTAALVGFCAVAGMLDNIQQEVEKEQSSCLSRGKFFTDVAGYVNSPKQDSDAGEDEMTEVNLS